MIHKEGRKLKDVSTMKKKNLLSLLKSGDAFLFKNGSVKEYFFVGRTMRRKEQVEGIYLDYSGKREKRIMSYDEIISRNPRVAYFQEIIAAQ